MVPMAKSTPGRRSTGPPPYESATVMLAMGLVMMGAAILRERMGDAEALASMDRIMDRLGEV